MNEGIGPWSYLEMLLCGFLICLGWPIKQPNSIVPWSQLFQGSLSPYGHRNLFSQPRLLCSLNKNLSYPIFPLESTCFLTPFVLPVSSLLFSPCFQAPFDVIFKTSWSLELVHHQLPWPFNSFSLQTTPQVLGQFSYWPLLLLEPVRTAVMKDSTE